jgi:putative membrane protein insertion efficiency factor
MFKKIIIFPIRVYQVVISPFLPKACVFHAHGKKSCSEYIISMIHEKGVAKGLFLGGFRILRCNPWQKVFDDPSW